MLRRRVEALEAQLAPGVLGAPGARLSPSEITASSVAPAGAAEQAAAQAAEEDNPFAVVSSNEGGGRAGGAVAHSGLGTQGADELADALFNEEDAVRLILTLSLALALALTLTLGPSP